MAVSRQSLKRSDSLRKASEARLKVGLASKLDVFRAELQAAQTQEALVRSEAALETALEQFRALLGLPAGRSGGARGRGPARTRSTTASSPSRSCWPARRERRLELRGSPATRSRTRAAPPPSPSRTSCPSST